MKRPSSSGFSLIESVIALGVLSLVMYSLTYFSAHRYFQISNKENLKCVEHSTETLNKIKSLGTAKFIAELNPQDNRIQRNAPADRAQYLNYVNANQEWLRQNETLWATAPDGSTILKNYKALVGFMSLLNSLYNSDNSFCQNAVGASYAGAANLELINSMNESEHLKNVTSSIRIQPYNRLNGNILPCSYPLYAIPGGFGAGANTAASAANITRLENGARTNIGFLVTVFTNYDDTDNQPRNCSVNAGFTYPTVSTNPSRMADLTVDIRKSSSSSSINNAAQFDACLSDMAQAQVTINTSVSNFRDRRAMTMMCRDLSTFQTPPSITSCWGQPTITQDFTVNSNWVPCRELTICGVSPSNAGSAVTSTGFDLRYSDVNLGCRIRVETRLLDAEQNIAAVSTDTSEPIAQRNGCTNVCPAPNYINRPGTAGWCPGGGRTVSNSCIYNPPPPPDGDGDGGGDGDGSGTDGGDSDGSGPDGGDGDGGHGG